MQWVGVLGAILVAAAWSIEMWEAIKRHKQLIDLRFAVVYLLGTVALMFYAFSLYDFVFAALNAAIALLVLFEIGYTVGWKFSRAQPRRK